MGWLNRKKDPISERARELSQQIRQLELQIENLHGPTPAATATTPESRDPMFETVRQTRLKDLHPPQPHFNELGIRKYDLPSAWRRLMNHVRGPTANNPKLVDLLAAGSLQGMRPLRYERRIARNRFIVFVMVLFLVLWGLAAVFVRR